MLVDLVDDVIHIQGVTLRDPRLDALLTALRHLVERVGQEAGPRVVRLDIGTTPSEPAAETESARDSSPLDGPSSVPIGIAPPSSERVREPRSTAAASVLLRKSLEWLDAVLLRYHRNQPSGAEFPGLTRSRASVDAALAAPVIEAAPESADAQDNVDNAERELRAALIAAPDDDRLARLYRKLDLTFLEFRAVLLCLAPELDAKYQVVYGVLNDDLARRAATLGLVCAVLEEPATASRSTAPDRLVRYELAQSAALTRWALTDHGFSFNYADQPLRLDASLAAWLLATDSALLEDYRLAALTRTHSWPGASSVEDALGTDLVSRLVKALEAPSDQRWIALENGDLDSSRAAIEAAAAELCRPLIRLSLQDASRSEAANTREVAAHAARAVQLVDAVLVIDCGVDVGQAEATAGMALLDRRVRRDPVRRRPYHARRSTASRRSEQRQSARAPAGAAG